MTYLGQIDMLRAMAKVEIICDDEHIKITKAELNCANDKGFCAPAGMFENTVNTASSLHIPIDARPLKAATKEYQDGTDKIVFYLPEYENSTGDTPAKVDVTFSVTDPQSNKIDTIERTIYFKEYSSYASQPQYDIVRDYLYRFTVLRFNTGLSIDYTMCPWEKYQINIPDFK